MSKTQYRTNGIAMLPEDWAIVNSIAEENGQSRSAAMREITRQHPVASRLILLGQAYLLSLLTPQEALERLADVALDVPLPIALTEKAEAALK